MDLMQILNFVLTIIIILVVYYSVISIKKRDEKKIRTMQENLKVKDKIITYSGLSGEIEEILEDRIIVKIQPSDILISIEKWAVAGIDDRNI